MPREEKDNYFAYLTGHEPEQLTLGHLVLETYETPLGRAHHSFAPLTDTTLESLANIHTWSGSIVIGKKRNMSFNVAIPAGGEIGPAFATEIEQMVSSEKGRRIEVKSPEALLSRVLVDQDVKAKLKLWTSVSRTKYLKRRAHIARPPKIWLLTGLVELEDATRSVVKKNEQGLRFGVSPEAIAALCSAPVGFTLDLGVGRTAAVESKLGGRLVYAARFQLLQTVYKTWDGNTALAENEFQLHPDWVFGANTSLGDKMEDGDGQESNVAEIRLLPPGVGDSDDDEMDDAFWKAFDTAEARMMTRVKRAQGEAQNE